MSKLIILVGISGSGKSTWTDSFLKRNNNYLRINRDDIRRVLVKDLVSYYTRKDVVYLEKIVSKIEYELFLALSDANKNIVIDNTNLKFKTIEQWINLAEQYHYEVSFKFFDMRLNTAKDNVILRDNYSMSIDKEGYNICSEVDYIDKQFQQYHIIKKRITDRFKNKIL